MSTGVEEWGVVYAANDDPIACADEADARERAEAIRAQGMFALVVRCEAGSNVWHGVSS